MNQVWLAFITGLTTGGISCFAVQGGLLASSLSRQKKEFQKPAVLIFLIGKIAGYAILGALLGLLGKSVLISPKLQGWMQIAAGLFMLLTVARLLDLHPLFRRFVISPPKSIFRLLRTRSIDEGSFSSFILGFLTILIPCGVTQAMMLLSVSSGNVLIGSLIMISFVLGTSPIFYILGVASSQIFTHKSLKFAAATAIFVLAVISINTGQVLRGSVHTLQNYWLAATNQIGQSGQALAAAKVGKDGKQSVKISISSRGYTSDTQVIKAGVPVRLTLEAINAQGCSRAFTIPEYNISQIMPSTGMASLEFTPTRRGRLTYTCSMGMYTGFFDVI